MSNCGCDDLCRNLSLLTGDKGDAGANGLDGTFSANADLYIFSTATVGNPTNTKLIFDNANVSAATSISVSNVDGYGNTVSGWLNLVATSNATLKAFIRVNKEFDSTAFAMYAVTAQTANAGYYTYTVTYVGGSGNSPFALNDNVIFSYVISGNNGAAGANASVVLFNNLTNPTSNDTAGALVNFLSETIPGGTFVADGDSVSCRAVFWCEGIPSGGVLEFIVKVKINGAVSLLTAQFSAQGEGMIIDFTIDRVDNATYRYSTSLLQGSTVNAGSIVPPVDQATNWANPMTIDCYAATATTATGYIRCKKLYAIYNPI